MNLNYKIEFIQYYFIQLREHDKETAYYLTEEERKKQGYTKPLYKNYDSFRIALIYNCKHYAKEIKKGL